MLAFFLVAYLFIFICFTMYEMINGGTTTLLTLFFPLEQLKAMVILCFFLLEIAQEGPSPLRNSPNCYRSAIPIALHELKHFEE